MPLQLLAGANSSALVYGVLISLLLLQVSSQNLCVNEFPPEPFGFFGLVTPVPYSSSPQQALTPHLCYTPSENIE